MKSTNWILSLIFLLSTCMFTQAQSALYIQNGARLTLQSDATLTIRGNLRANDSGDTSAIANSGIVEVTGNWINNGTGLLNDNSTGSIELEGTSSQSIQGSSQFYDLVLNNTTGASISSGVNRINHELNVLSGTLTTNDSLTLVATPTGTGRIADLSSGTVNGDVIIEAYVETSPYDFKFLTIPVQNATLAEWSDDFIMTGFPGSQFPTFNFMSIYFYDETKSGDRNARYDSATNITNTVPMGVGVQAYNGSTAFKIDAKGPIYSGNQTLPVTFTDDATQPNSEDGWNLVANPYPSTIDWDAGNPNVQRQRLNNAIYVYESTSMNYQSYINGAGTNGGSRYIPSSQAFFVQATSNNPILRFREGAKVANEVSFVEGSGSGDLLRLRLSNSSSNDEIVIRYNQFATSRFDANWDAIKIPGSSSNPIITAIHDSVNYSILSLPEDTIQQDIYIKAEVPTDGVYSLEVCQLPSNAQCLFIEDLFTGRIESLRDSSIFHFTLDDSTTVSRFKLRPTKVANYTFGLPPRCANDSVSIDVTSDRLTAVLVRRTQNGNSTQQIDSNLVSTNYRLPADIYYFNASYTGCSDQLDTIDLSAPAAMVNLGFSTLDSGFGSGRAWVSSSGGVPPYRYIWSDSLSQTTDTAVGLIGGTSYSVYITDSNGCMDSATVFVGNLAVGLEEEDIGQLEIYPNPADQFIQIEQENNRFNNYSIKDAFGREVLQGSVQSNRTKINVTNLSAGLYFIQFLGNESERMLKIKIVR